jgi:hypothetical protein
MKRTLAIGLLGAALFGQAVPASQADPFTGSTGHLTLAYTVLHTAEAVAVGEGQCVPVIDRLVFDCPGKRHSTCTVVVTLSMPYAGLTPDWIATLGGTIDGDSTVFSQDGGLFMASEVDRLWLPNMTSITLVAPAIPRGFHALKMCLYVVNGGEATEYGSVFSAVRTLKVEVYKP